MLRSQLAPLPPLCTVVCLFSTQQSEWLFTSTNQHLYYKVKISWLPNSITRGKKARSNPHQRAAKVLWVCRPLRLHLLPHVSTLPSARHTDLPVPRSGQALICLGASVLASPSPDTAGCLSSVRSQASVTPARGCPWLTSASQHLTPLNTLWPVFSSQHFSPSEMVTIICILPYCQFPPTCYPPQVLGFYKYLGMSKWMTGRKYVCVD